MGEDGGERWEDHNFRTSRKLNMPLNWTGWTDGASLVGVKKKPRVMGVLNTKAWEFWRSASAEERKHPPPLMIDLTQGVQFRSAGSSLGTLLQKSCIYSYELDYVLNATDIFVLVRVDKREIRVDGVVRLAIVS